MQPGDIRKAIVTSGSHQRLGAAAGREVLADGFLAVGNHEDNLGDARGDRLFHRVLDKRLVDDREHLLRYGLGGRQHSGAQSGGKDHGFGDGAHWCILQRTFQLDIHLCRRLL